MKRSEAKRSKAKRIEKAVITKRLERFLSSNENKGSAKVRQDGRAENGDNAERHREVLLGSGGANKSSVFENRVAPDGTVSRHVRRDVVRKAASATKAPAHP